MPRKKNLIASTFKPKVWDQLDQRGTVARAVKDRLAELKNDHRIDSTGKEMLAERAVFIELTLQTMEVNAAETGDIDLGKYAQAVNALNGLLTKLGLEPAERKTPSLRAYVDGRTR